MDSVKKWLGPVGSWGKWVIATGFGLYVGWSLNLVIRPLLAVNRIDLEWPLDDLRTAYMNLDLAGFILLALLSGLVTGAIVGLFQWLALLRKTGDMALWIPATAIGFGIDSLLGGLFFLVDYSYWAISRGQFPPPQAPFRAFLFVITPFLGAFLVGLCQWLVLRRRVRFSGLWLLAMPIATILTLRSQNAFDILYDSLSSWIMRLAPTMPVGVIALTKILYPLPYLFEGIVVGAVTGIVIALLIKQSTKRSQVPITSASRPVNP